MLKVFTIISLLLIFFQDIKSRAVYWILFPFLIILFVAEKLIQAQNLMEIWQPVLINIAFIAIQLLLVSAWFSLRQKKWVNITDHLLGLGDILFLLSIAFYLSMLNFIIFYVISLLFSLVTWMFWQQLTKSKDTHIPLAGLQAILFAGFLITDWCVASINITSDNWLLNFIS